MNSQDPSHAPRSSGATGRRARNSVSREEILDQALAIVDAEGLEALSMRNLAHRLDTGPMRAYRHFENKEALIEALADVQAQRIRAIDVSGITDPREILTQLALQTRELILEHPNLAPVTVSRPLSKTTAADDLALANLLLTSAGFADFQVGPVAAALTAYTFGFVLYEIGQRRFHDESRDEMLAYYDELADQVASDPLLVRQVDGIRHAVDNDWGAFQFEAGLRALLDGFWSQIGEQDGE